jgi:hypothetical protein
MQNDVVGSFRGPFPHRASKRGSENWESRRGIGSLSTFARLRLCLLGDCRVVSKPESTGFGFAVECEVVLAAGWENVDREEHRKFD